MEVTKEEKGFVNEVENILISLSNYHVYNDLYRKGK